MSAASARHSVRRGTATGQNRKWEILPGLGVAADRIYLDHSLTGINRERPGLRDALAAVRAVVDDGARHCARIRVSMILYGHYRLFVTIRSRSPKYARLDSWLVDAKNRPATNGRERQRTSRRRTHKSSWPVGRHRE